MALNYRRIEPWDLGLILIGLFILKYLIMAPFMAALMVLAVPFTILSWLFRWEPPDFPWGTAVGSIVITGVYVGAWYRRGVPPGFKPPWLMELLAHIIRPLEARAVEINRRRRNRGAVRPAQGDTGPGASGGQLVRWEGPTGPNEALERLMGDLLAHQPEQGWLAGMAGSLRDQARAGRLQANMERVVAILEQEKKRMQALVEINRLGGQMSQAGLAADVEAKRIALERLKLEHEGQRIAVEMSELLGLKEVKVKERSLREKEIELQTARTERELEDLRRVRETPSAPQPQETLEEYAARRADLLIKYAAEIKRIRSSVDDPEVADDLVDRFLVDIGQRERR